MSATIWKYTVPVDDRPHALQMPREAAIVHVASQLAAAKAGYQLPVDGSDAGQVDFWAFVEVDEPMETRTFLVRGTGHAINTDVESYVGTALVGPLVWHLLEVKK